MAITIGTDPEAFVKTADGTITTAIGMIGGSKEAPLPVVGGAVQEDNVLAEFNTEPADTAEGFVAAIGTVIEQLSSILGNVGLSLDFRSSHEYDYDTLAQAGPQAMMFGCDPDLNAWTMEENDAPAAEGATLRTAGGHVHIGYDNPDRLQSTRVARLCDVYLGIPSVLLDDDTRRRELYGSAGAHRIKEYGVEYRVLSNFWLRSDSLKRWVFNQAASCVEWADQEASITDICGGAEEIQRIINTGDKEAAASLVKHLNITMPEV